VYRAKYTTLWWSTDTRTPVLGDAVLRRRQRENASETERLLDWLAAEIERYPDSPEERRLARQGLEGKVRRFGQERLGWPEGYRKLVFADEFFRSTVEFVRQARAFDPRIRLEDVTQALRNVWIANSLQMLLDLEVGLSPAIFAYSMLYPCTDNYLDSPEVAAGAKRQMNRRLGLRLAGETTEPLDGHEARVFRLIELIEDHYPRPQYPEVYLSIEAIYRAQIRSLALQGPSQSPFESDVLGISVEKGGTSVLADGYLTAGSLRPDEAELCFGYGVFLQLLDDLQDVGDDRQAGHVTIFSLTAAGWPLDRITSRLYHFIGRVLHESPRFVSPRYDDLKDLIRRNCTFLLLGAIAEHSDLFTPRFLGELETRCAFNFSSMRTLRRSAQKRYSKTADSLRRQRRASSLFDLLE
jgi:hypothetical protein